MNQHMSLQIVQNLGVIHFSWSDDMISEYWDAKSDAMSKSRMMFSSVNYSRNPIPEWNIHSFPNTRNDHHRRNTPPIPPMINTGSHGLRSPEVASYQDIYVESDLPPRRVYCNTRMIDQMPSTEQSNSSVNGGTSEVRKSGFLYIDHTFINIIYMFWITNM
jgi:hypothetical protein